MDFPTVLVVDFGAQYAQLIARRIREAEGVVVEVAGTKGVVIISLSVGEAAW